MTKKVFDCVEMMHEGAARVQAITAGMTVDEEVAYWRERTDALRRRQAILRADLRGELFRDDDSSGTAISVVYDAEADILHIRLNDAPIEESDEAAPGVVVDLAEDRRVVGLEIHDASTVVRNPRELQFTIRE